MEAKKAIKIVSESLTANTKIASDYLNRAKFYITIGDIKKAKTCDSLAESFLAKVAECEDALSEITGPNGVELKKVANV